MILYKQSFSWYTSGFNMSFVTRQIDLDTISHITNTCYPSTYTIHSPLRSSIYSLALSLSFFLHMPTFSHKWLYKAYAMLTHTPIIHQSYTSATLLPVIQMYLYAPEVTKLLSYYLYTCIHIYKDRGYGF